MRRIGFRRLLPVINVVVYLALMYAGFAKDLYDVFERRLGSVRTSNTVLTSAAWQEGPVEWDPEHVDYWIPASHQLAYAINLPANISGSVVATALWRGLKLWKLHWGVFWGEAVFVAGWTFVFVPVLWFYVGRWIDCRFGILPGKQLRQTTTAKTLRILAASGSTLLTAAYVTLAIYATVVVRLVSAVELCRMFFWLFWLVFITFATTSNLRQPRRQASSAKSA